MLNKVKIEIKDNIGFSISAPIVSCNYVFKITKLNRNINIFIEFEINGIKHIQYHLNIDDIKF